MSIWEMYAVFWCPFDRTRNSSSSESVSQHVFLLWILF